MDFGSVPVSRTVFILTSEPPESGGGVEHFVRELVKGLETRGYRTEVFHRGNSEPQWLAGLSGRFGKKLAGTLCGYWIGRNAERHMSGDVAAVISNSDVGYYPVRHATPFRRIHFYHGTYRGQAKAIRPFIKYAGYLYLKWWASMVLEGLGGRGKLVLCNSDQTREEVRRFFGYDSVTRWLPLDTELFKPLDIDASRAALNLPKGKPIGVFVGSAHPTKGFPVVRSLIDRMPEVHWVLALRGDSPEDMADRPNVTILRDVPHDQIPALYSAADFSICPSLYEAFGYVVAESLACGTPVIATPGGASRLFLREVPVDRLLIPEKDSANGFLAAAREVLRAPDAYRRAVIEQVRPKLVNLLVPDNWWRRFFEVTGL
jgi:glycosyltransferase involved in cell wall biosynthesis